MVTSESVVERLRAVMDPEIPTASIVDLGMVARVVVGPERIEVELLPTFLGCPAQPMIAADVMAVLREAFPAAIGDVRFVHEPAWDSSRVTDAGWEALKEYGISREGLCPYCGGTETELSSPFGPAPCRTTHFCRSCRNVFEGFKTKQVVIARRRSAS